MTAHELAMQCKQAIESGGPRGVVIVVPGPAPRGERIRLDRTSRRKCPTGEVLSWTERGTVARFDAVDVLAWLAANGLIEVDARVRPSEVRDGK